jgi:hypothetical protein
MGRPRKELSVVRTFLGPRVLTLPEISSQWQCSGRTVLRRLQEHGYYSSYNYRGKFITIEEVARFDSRGLWVCKGARFSKLGTLKNTVHKFVQVNEKGMTHEELAALLGLRVHDTLLDLVEEDKICRERLGPSFVYLACRRSLQRAQMRRRREFMKTLERPRPTSRQKIATLLELIKNPKATRQEILRRCKRTGLVISREVVDVIFEEFELDKKRAR